MGRLPEPVRSDLLAGCRFVQFVPGQHLLRQGERDRHAIVLLDGLVKIRIVDPTGFAAVLAFRRRGDIVGEVGALTGEPRSASVLAATPVWGAVIGGPELSVVVAAHPAVTNELIRAQGRRLDWANQRRVDAAARPARWKIARALSDLAREVDREAQAVRIHLSQRELASLVGVGLNTVEETLRHLSGMGLVIRFYRTILIPDQDRLRTFAESDPQNP
jgi:CRP/FNR family transcriptional regulator, cyclic AMP receptor protein